MNEQIHRQKGHSLMAADKTGHMETGGGLVKVPGGLQEETTQQ